MFKSRVSDIKKERKKALFFRELVSLIQELGNKEKDVAEVFVSHVDISPNSGICYIYFSTYKEPGDEVFHKVFPTLMLYRASLRTAFAKRIQVRYVPEIIFLYDKAKERERRVNDLLNKIQDQDEAPAPEADENQED